jgi:hypothetical protein
MHVISKSCFNRDILLYNSRVLVIVPIGQPYRAAKHIYVEWVGVHFRWGWEF